MEILLLSQIASFMGEVSTYSDDVPLLGRPLSIVDEFQVNRVGWSARLRCERMEAGDGGGEIQNPISDKDSPNLKTTPAAPLPLSPSR
ncbi:hypothetical protein NEUTE1DRAFT_101003 [Neurospora tetrasperma FGSC 2508]|uniref:Uncharacterized protein n=1 Tax=Neurospora tetrasperma (strain FGSC 2508 / ATCC MYA-4615 / P0657) TaxID=510951 RepID=F8MJU3_NEUT8|nr:uncharacterized protein NEUTE1DRAFT_101003 [Neurospora tetrasperma FGSC 2508]EGO58130.1 hypothetical protein NEUTE1DRAFT_101003 [Neurospora tetrasperma FGSC 2508]EGZ71561.1 hypothetical protein NEUTE2DRAFT_128950 [Neurospora tetrasperma FGSC 2509]